MGYNKYGKTKNVTDNKNLKQWILRYPDLHGESYVITEKIDGSNFQLIFTKGEELRFGSRNNELGITADFFDFQNAVLTQYTDNIEKIQNYVDFDNFIDELCIFGELFGGGIQRRINYGPNKKFLPFHMRADGMPLSVSRSLGILKDIGISWWVPVLSIGRNLDEAINYHVEEVKTMIGCDDELSGNRFIEGVVIEPYETVRTIYHDQDDTISRFMLKKKNEKFSDSMRIKHKKVKQDELTNDGLHLMSVWSGMFNDNRMQDLCSKIGRPTEMNQMGEYIKALIADVREDFINIHRSEFIGLTNGDRKIIMGSGGKLAAKIVRSEIEK